jgi:predicted transcriptional regulator
MKTYDSLYVPPLEGAGKKYYDQIQDEMNAWWKDPDTTDADARDGGAEAEELRRAYQAMGRLAEAVERLQGENDALRAALRSIAGHTAKELAKALHVPPPL